MSLMDTTLPLTVEACVGPWPRLQTLEAGLCPPSGQFSGDGEGPRSNGMCVEGGRSPGSESIIPGTMRIDWGWQAPAEQPGEVYLHRKKCSWD